MKKYQRLLKNAMSRLVGPGESKILAILGARQVGKTTLLLDFASAWQGQVVKYVGDKLEHASLWRGKFSDVKNDLELNLGTALEELKQPALLIFDEIQKIPEAFNNLKVLHDSFKGKIKIAISGSSSLALLYRTTESLGGRVEIATMYPLSFTEILSDSPQPIWLKRGLSEFSKIKARVLEIGQIREKADQALAKALTFGLFPEAYLQDDPEEARLLHQNYHQTYIEKDIRDLKQVGNILDFDQIWKISQRTSGQLLNYANLSQETGLAFNTVKKYVAVLTASFNCYLLLPFAKNIKRRIVRSPKIFSVDPGFFNHCLNLYDREKLIKTQLVGRVFESVMIGEFLKQERSFVLNGEPYFFRTSAGAEVDLVVENDLDLLAFEFKYGEKVTRSDFNGIKSLVSAVPGRVKAGFVVSRQPAAERYGENLFAVPWWYFCA